MTSPTDREFEQMLQEKGLNAPRITPDLIQANIKEVHYFTALQGSRCAVMDYVIEEPPLEIPQPEPLNPALGLLTFCVLVLQNGFTVTGESACASPENFDAEAGRIAARRNAENKIWPLMGYELKCRLAAQPKTHVERMVAEHAEVVDRILKLDTFTNSEAFQSLPELERTDLLEQGILMAKYRNKLKERLDRALAA